MKTYGDTRLRAAGTHSSAQAVALDNAPRLEDTSGVSLVWRPMVGRHTPEGDCRHVHDDLNGCPCHR
jgi:hypothetical protein